MLFTFLDYQAFQSVWYWVLVIVAWSLTCHYTLGVPFDIVARANRHGGQAAEDCDQLVMIHARRIDDLMAKAGAIFVGSVTFLLVSLLTLGFWFGYELATAFFLILGPISLVGALGARLSLRVLSQTVTGEKLRAMIARRRFWDQFIGVVAVCFSAVTTAWHVVAGEFAAQNGVSLGRALLTMLADLF